MFEFILGVVGGFVGLLISILPASPFIGLSLSGDVGNAIAWLNWVVPVGSMLNLMVLWAAGLLALAIAKKIGELLDKVTGINTLGA